LVFQRLQLAFSLEQSYNGYDETLKKTTEDKSTWREVLAKRYQNLQTEKNIVNRNVVISET